MLTDGQKLKQCVENQSRSVKSIYTELGVSKAAWYKYYESERMEPETKANIERVLKASIFNIDQNTPVSDFKTDYSQVSEKSRIDGLIESNRMMAAAMLGDMENRTILIKSNEALTSMVGRSENVWQGMSLDQISKVSEFLELIAEIGMGKKLWTSKSQAIAVLNKFVPAPNKYKVKKDTHDSDGK